jgi:hypothetical protein
MDGMKTFTCMKPGSNQEKNRGVLHRIFYLLQAVISYLYSAGFVSSGNRRSVILPTNFSILKIKSVLYGEAVYFFLADDDLQQRE